MRWHVVAAVGLGMVLLLPHGLWALWYGFAFSTLAFSGVEDALYYVLDGPASLPLLDADPLILIKPVTRAGLIGSASIWLLAWGLSLVGIWLVRRCRLERP
jgi:hypothetical protein